MSKILINIITAYHYFHIHQIVLFFSISTVRNLS